MNNIKEDFIMQCLIFNTCENTNLCCNFCNVKKCNIRCLDNYKKCKYYDGEFPKRGRPKKEDCKNEIVHDTLPTM